MTPKENPTQHNIPPNLVLNVPADPNSDPGFSDSSFLDSYDSSDEKYYKRRRYTKIIKIIAEVKHVSVILSKMCKSYRQATYS